MPEPLSRSQYSTTADGHLVIEGGTYPSYANGPGPTEWVTSNRVFSLDLNNFQVTYYRLYSPKPMVT